MTEHNGRPVVVPPKMTLRVTIVRVHVPFWRRLFSGELVFGVTGTVQDVALLSRAQAQELFQAGHEAKWVPYRAHDATDPHPLKGPGL